MTTSCQTKRFQQLGLWRNPFGELTLEERVELAVVDLEQYREHLSKPRSVIQFLGPCGHGKTTHLLALRRLWPEAVYLYLPEEGRRPAIPRDRPLLLDEAQRLGRWQRWQLLRGDGPLGIATHDDLSPLLRKHGYDVHDVAVTTTMTAERLRKLLNRRIAAAAIDPQCVPELCPARAVSLQARFGNNVRAIEGYLYEWFQQRSQKESPWPLVN